MDQNIGIKVVAWVFALGSMLGTLLGIILISFWIVVVSFGLDRPQFAFDSSVTVVNPDAVPYIIAIGILILLLSRFASPVSKGLRKLLHGAYKAAILLTGAFSLISIFLLFTLSSIIYSGSLEGFSQQDGTVSLVTMIVIISVAILIVSIVVGITLFINRNLFTNR